MWQVSATVWKDIGPRERGGQGLFPTLRYFKGVWTMFLLRKGVPVASARGRQMVGATKPWPLSEPLGGESSIPGFEKW